MPSSALQCNKKVKFGQKCLKCRGMPVLLKMSRNKMISGLMACVRVYLRMVQSSVKNDTRYGSGPGPYIPSLVPSL